MVTLPPFERRSGYATGLRMIRLGSLSVLHISSLDRRMTMNRLKLNADKTQLMWLDTRQAHCHSTTADQSKLKVV